MSIRRCIASTNMHACMHACATMLQANQSTPVGAHLLPAVLMAVIGMNGIGASISVSASWALASFASPGWTSW